MRKLPAAIVVVACSPFAIAEVIYQSTGPFGGPFGLWGADVFTGQSVAQRFEAPGTYRLDLVRLWFMSNDFAGTVEERVVVSIQTDGGGPDESFPGGVVLERVEFIASAIGWDPVEEHITFSGRPWLFEGERYWVVCESEAGPGEDPVWLFASEGLGFTSYRPWDALWYPGGTGAELCMTIEATPASCLADHAPPFGVLDLADLQAFVGDFSGGLPGADLAEPRGVLDLADIAAFVDAFLGGCP
jgi:hypothetical protein